MNYKLIILVLTTILTSSLYAQKNVDSPYSNYGLGQLRLQATEENRIMGGISAYSDSIRLNLQNPAAYGDLKYTTFIVGANLSKSEFSTQNRKISTKNSAMDYIALGFPIAKNLGVGAGLLPYSSVGYKLTSESLVSNNKVINQNEGEGSINRAFLSLGYQLAKGLNIGTSLYVNFGNIELTNIRSEQNVQLATREFSKSAMKGVNYNIGVSYHREITDKLTLMSSISYAPKAKLLSSNTRNLSTLEYSPQNGAIVVRDSEDVNLGKYNLAKTELTMPSQLSLGMGIGEDKKWFAGINYIYLGTKKFGNPFIPSSDLAYENAYSTSIGGFYVPQYNSFTDYWKRIAYRFGIRYEKTGMLLKNHSINDFGISFGFTLPLKGLSNVTIGLEYGQKGTTNDNLVKENYFNLRIGLSLNDKWFQKTKYQ